MASRHEHLFTQLMLLAEASIATGTAGIHLQNGNVEGGAALLISGLVLTIIAAFGIDVPPRR